jgi:hypothetical protein
MNIGERAEELIHIKLDLKNGHGLFKLYVVSTGAIDRLRDEFKNEIEVDFVFLITIGVKEGSELYDVWMTDKTHNLEFAILEALILENLLDGNLLFLLGHVEKASGKDDAKGAIAYDLAIGILNLLCLTRLSIASDDLDYFVWVVREADAIDRSGHL